MFYRRIAANQPTILLDEVDAIFNKKSEATEGLRACLNAGNLRGTTVPRCQPPRMDIVEFAVFCAKALAGIGGLPATITDRSIPIEMRRKGSGDRVERFRARKARELTAQLVAGLEAWSDEAVEELQARLEIVETLADDGKPLESLDDRAFEQAWEPLLAVASLAGEEWLRAAVAAALELSGSRDDELDVGVNLLHDVKAVFDASPNRESLPTYDLLDALLALEESPWRDWWSDPRSEDVKPSKAAPRKLARMLKPFGIRPVDVWTPSGAARKGYRLDDFRDAWVRYLVGVEPSTRERDGRGAQEPSSDAGFSLAHADHESAREHLNGRDGRGDLAQTERSRPPRPSRPFGERRADEWLARDGKWHSLADDPPLFPGEVVETRNAGDGRQEGATHE